MKPSLRTCALGASLLFSCSGLKPEGPATLTGLVDATEIDVASKVPGRVKELKVQEGDTVTEGQELATIESDDLDAKLSQATAATTAATARLQMAQHGARSEDKAAAEGTVEAAKHQVELAQKMFERMKTLLTAGSIPQATYDDVESKYNLAKDQLAIARTRLDLVQRGARPEEIDALGAQLSQTQGLLAEVTSYEKEMVQKAPLASVVSKVILHKGELAATGSPIVTLVDLSQAWVTFPVREDLLKQVKVGAVLQVELPALGTTVPMKVFNISALGDFATWRATSDKGGFDLKSFEVKARPAQPVDGLRPGMTARWVP
jgi:HlyD family secretion protein